MKKCDDCNHYDFQHYNFGYVDAGVCINSYTELECECTQFKEKNTS